MKWVSTWGNAMSYREVEVPQYAKDRTLRYTILCMHNANKIRLSFDNFTNEEAITLNEVTIDLNGQFYDVTFNKQKEVTIDAYKQLYSDELNINITKGDIILVSFYLKDYTSMMCGVLTTGPYSSAQFAKGNVCHIHTIDKKTSKKTNWVHFLNQVDLYTDDNNEGILCYGDSITSQDWPDYLQMELFNNNLNKSVIRRAVSGTRVLREYDCYTYLAYGLKGEKRFDHEMIAEGIKSVVILQGINDIIHPVGEQINEYRPMSDLPSSEELINGLKTYIDKAKKYGYKVYMGTLLPIEGWRTYADFREVLRNEVNEWIRNSGEEVIDFDKVLRDPLNIHRFKKEYDSGDHLHPSKLGYMEMAKEAYKILNN